MTGARRANGFGGLKREFAWQAQGIGHLVKIVAGAVFCGRCQNFGRRVIRSIAFYVAGAGNSHHGSYVLKSKASIPENG